MFEIIGYHVLRAAGMRDRRTSGEVFGSLYTRPDEGPAEFVVGLITCAMLVLVFMVAMELLNRTVLTGGTQ